MKKRNDAPKIVHIASGDLWAGAEAQLFNLALKLKLRTNLHIVLLNEGKLARLLRKAGISTTVISESNNSMFQLFYKLIRTLRPLNPHILHTHRRKENILGGLAGILLGAICIRTLHGVPERKTKSFKPGKSISEFVESIMVKLVFRATIIPAEKLANEATVLSSRGDTFVIENGIDIEQALEWSNRDEPSSPFIGAGRSVAFVGRLVPVKRPDIFIEMARRLLLRDSEIGEVNFYVFGDGPLLSDMRHLANDYRITKHVKFLGHSEDIYQLLKGMDVVVLCSDGEGLPMVLLESMVLGVPIVAHAVGAIPDLLAHGGAGTLVTKHDPEGYATAVTESLQSKDVKKKAEEAEKRVRANYSIEKCTEKYLAIYDRLIKDM